MSKLIALLTIAAVALGGCDDQPTTNNTDSVAARTEPADVASEAPRAEASSMELQPQSLSGLQRMKAALDAIDWRCDEKEGLPNRTAAIRLRSMLEIFQRVCRDASAGDQAQQLRVAQLADGVRAKIAGCARLGAGALAKSADPCDVTGGGGVR